MAEQRGAQTRADLDVLLDTVDLGLFIFDAGGRVVSMSRWARERFLSHDGRVPETVLEMRLGDPPLRPDGTPEPLLPAERALRGERSETELLFSGGRRLLIQATPITDADGRIVGAVSISRDITELHAAIAGRARLDGAVKTARLLAHEINNQLALLVGYGTLLTGRVDGDLGDTIATMVGAAEHIAELVHRLQGIVRFEERDFGGGPMLDLDAATTERRRRPRA
jgi:nitrogen-specific signal transduction histidine kinase